MGEAQPLKKCPICKTPAVETYRPFCSKRCADIDLGRWLNGAYVVQASEDADEDGAAEPAQRENR